VSALADRPHAARGPDVPRVLHAHTAPRFTLECGAVLEDVRQAFHLDGALNEARDNLVLVFHALTGSADAAGDWWRELIGPGRAIDTTRYAVLAPNLLGSCYGTTGPRVGGPAFPAVTPRDMARLAGLLVDALGVTRVALATGGSLGGMVALEWALLHPGRADAAAVLAAPAAHTAWAIGWNHVQREAVRRFGVEGRALARQAAMLSFRTEGGLEHRFARAEAEGDFSVRRWLAQHGDRLVRRFDPASFVALLDAMDAHDVGRGRGGVEAALATLRASGTRVIAAGIPGDVLYSADVVRAWAELAGAEYVDIVSDHGHDAFLLETAQVGAILRSALGTATPCALGAAAPRALGGAGGPRRAQRERREPGARTPQARAESAAEGRRERERSEPRAATREAAWPS